MKDGYKEPSIYTYQNATVRVYSPILTEQEKTIRLKQVYAAATDLMKDLKKG